MLQKVITTALAECIYYQPSVLFLDDIESITNASTNDEENTPDAINAARYFHPLRSSSVKSKKIEGNIQQLFCHQDHRYVG